MPLQAGTRLGPYEIIALIGAGGMGEVWLATELRLGRKVALKLLPPDLTRDPARILRFEQEAKSASALNHPNVCTIHALGETSEGQHYIAMEYVEGETLRRRLASARLSLREALDVGIQVAAALSVAHTVGIVHRDIKPENVMLRPDGVVKVLDFGLAKLAAVGPPGAETTQLGVNTEAGTVVGTAAYMSPEQARGQQVDARTDIWSLGVMLYEMIAGSSPFAAPSGSDVLAAILQKEPAPVARFEPDAPAELQRILTKMLRKDRSQRYQTVQDLRLDLAALRDALHSPAGSGSAPISAITTQAAQAASASGHSRVADIRRRRGVALGAAAAVLVMGATLGLWWWTTARAPDSAGTNVPVHRKLTRLTFGSGLQTDVTFSPDGRFIAYASDRAGNFDIWVQSVGGGNPVQVTQSPAQDTQPDWSQDGSTLVFRSERDGGGIFLVPALGGVERQLTSFGSYPVWSPNGQEILFVDAAALGDSESPTRLYAVSVGEGRPREMLANFLQGGGWSWIARHPDGRISAMGDHRQLGRGFFTMARDGTRLVQSKEAPNFPLRAYLGGSYVRRRFRWHPSGAALYVQAETDGVYNLWKVRVEPRTLVWLSAERLTTGTGPDVTAAVSDDGTHLAFSSEHGSTRLWLFPLDPVGRRLGPGKPLTEDDAIASASELSPDGRYVAYNLRRPGSDRDELWITNIDDGKSEVVAPGAGNPVWSLDGKTLAYAYLRLNRQPTTGAVAIRQLGGRERFISQWTTTTLFFPTDWAEPGLLGTYLSRGASASLALWPITNPEADKPDRVLISKRDTDLWQGKFSPNRRWLSFVAGNEILVASGDGLHPERWSRIAGDHRSPADKPRWAPDGQLLYFISRRPTSYFNLWAVRIDPELGRPVGQPFPITRFDSPSLVISPDVTQSEMDVSFRHAVLTMKTVSGSIWMLDNVDK
jgi:eukaryotic-like serine/threonine-protein kinase